MRFRAAVIGGTGYGGGEMIRHLLRHPDVELVRVTAADNIGRKLGDVHQNLYGLTDLEFEEMPAREAARDCDLVLMGLPHRVSAKVAMELFESDVRIVDMSGDFRLRDVRAYEKDYQAAHPCPEALGTFVYGLPEMNRERIRGARRVASPGCFATTIAIGLLPLARAGLLGGPVRTVGVTGSSGSGAAPSAGVHHAIRSKNLRIYRPLAHQHRPEIVQTLTDAGARDLVLEFVPVSAPLSRGILATTFVDVPADFTEDRVRAIWEETFRGEPFVKVVEGGRYPEVAGVSGTNYVEVGFSLGPAEGGRRTLLCLSALDNLVKGGGGQAIQSMNLMLGLDERTTLEDPGLWP